jgi:hypothetical protein
LGLRNACLLLWLGGTALSAGEHRGWVRSAGQPIPGATVTASQPGRKLVTVTDANGQYAFEDLTPGVWVLAVEMFGFQPAQREITVTTDHPAPPLQWSLELKPPPASRPPTTARQGIGFQRLAVAQSNLENQIAAAMLEPPQNLPAPETTLDANEAFLVTGSLSRGLQAPRNLEEMIGEARGMSPGPGGLGPFGAGAEVPGFPPSSGPGPAMAGPGGRGGPPGSGYPARGRPFGGPAAAGAAGRGMPPWMAGRGVSVFGNRRIGNRSDFRGNLFFSLRNSAMDAKPYSLTGQPVEKPSYALARFGLAAGGALRIPKLVHSESTFFFVNYFGTRSRNPYNAFATVPSFAERQGDFSRSAVRGPVTIYDPLSSQPFAGNSIPPARMSRAALGLLEFIPAPNLPGPVQNYHFVTSVTQNTDNFGVRLMHSLRRQDRLSFRLNAQTRDAEAVQLFGFRDHLTGLGLNTEIQWTHNFGARLINNLRYNFSRNRSQTVPFFAYKRDIAGELGIQGTSRDPVNFGPPNLNFTNFGDLTDSSPLLQRNQTSSASESILVVRGAHNISLGGEFRRLQINARTDQNARGTFVFTGLATSAFDERGLPAPGTGLDFADFLLGLPQSSSIRFGSSNNYFRASAVSLFAQDDWRLRPNFSVNLGLRYEYFTPYREKYNRMANLDVAPGFTAVAVVTPGAPGPYSGPFPAGLVDPDRNNFSPRLGLAWRPSSKRSLQIRAGYGLFYNGSIYAQFPGRLASQPPFASTATLNTSPVRVLTIENGFATQVSKTITNTYAVDRRYRVPYAQTWNLSVQQDLPHSFVVELGYLGTKGTRLDIQRLPNRAAPGSPFTAEQRRQIANAVGFTFESSEGNSIYHAAQMRLMRRFRRGVSVNALYTFSKSIDNASTFGGAGAVVAQNDKDLRAERGLSSFDQRHNLSLFYVLSSGFGAGGARFAGRRWIGRLLGDWTLSGGLTASSGTPLTARVLGNLADTGGTGALGSGRADATGAPIRDGGRFFNPAAFTPPPAGRFGNAGRNTIPGPVQLALNASLARSVRLGEDRRRLEIRLDSFNVTNHVSFTRLGTVVNASDYGLPTATAPMRTLSAGLRFNF